MQAEEFLKNLKSERIEPVYLFLGDADFLIEEAWRKLLSVIPSGGLKNSGAERVNARETGAGSIIEKLSTLPMFCPKKVVMVTNVDSWSKTDLNSI